MYVRFLLVRFLTCRIKFLQNTTNKCQIDRQKSHYTAYEIDFLSTTLQLKGLTKNIRKTVE